MKISFVAFGLSMVFFTACAQNNERQPSTSTQNTPPPTASKVWGIADFLSTNEALDKEVDRIFTTLDDTARVAQLLMPAVGRLGNLKTDIDAMIKARIIGGVLMLNGTKEEFTSWIKDFNELNAAKGGLPFLYSADAEPSLVNRKILGSRPVKKANEMLSIEEVKQYTDSISADLKEIGINYNFAPVVDMSPNKTVGFRSFGKIPANIIPWSSAFIERTQSHGIIATAKHFPGHGLVSGDTHKSLQVIDGELKEINNYPPLIAQGVLSIMIGHLAVQNNAKYSTNGLPATLSSVIIKELLRKEMQFKGLVVTDAMNMGGVVAHKSCEVKAVAAGNDIVLMPVNCRKAHTEILSNYRSDTSFKATMDEAVKRIIRMKLCLGLLTVQP